MFEESICHLKGVVSFCRFFLFRSKIPLAHNVEPDQMPHYVASDLGLRCLPITSYEFPGKNGLTAFRET